MEKESSVPAGSASRRPFASFIVLGAAFLLVSFVSCSSPSFTDDYYNYTKTGGPLEAKYAALGPFATSYAEYDADDKKIEKFEIWYPAELPENSAKYPIVFFVNGTGMRAQMIKPYFVHLASWGFITVGNEDENTRSGASTIAGYKLLEKLNADSDGPFYGKIDLERVGIVGHSQGGVGAINAATSPELVGVCKALCPNSATSPYWGQDDVFGAEWRYDLTKTRAATFLTAGDGFFDAGRAESIEPKKGQGICPLWSLRENFAAVPDDCDKAIARKANVDHGSSFHEFDGYIVAWLLARLNDDEEAAAAFRGDDAELARNGLYKDVQISVK